MAARTYLVPRVGDGLTLATSFRPKYAYGVVDFSGVFFGLEPTMLIVAQVTPAQHTALNAQPDVVALPADLDSVVGGNLALVQSELESLNLPAHWVTVDMTYRFVVRISIRIMRLLQYVYGLAPAAGRFFANGGLDNTIGDLPVVWRQRLSTAAASYGFDTSAFTLATPIRNALYAFGLYLSRMPVAVGGESL